MTGAGTPGFLPTGHPLFSGDVDVPPAPPVGSAVLAGLLDRAVRIAEGGAPAQAVADLAVHAWMEGHLDGEDHCDGCAGACGFSRGADRPALILEACLGGRDPGAVPGLVAPGPVPPFPGPGDPVFVAIVLGALGLMGEGRPPERILPMVAARAWAEGHIEGEERCPGCGWRGGLTRGADRDAIVRGGGAGGGDDPAPER